MPGRNVPKRIEGTMAVALLTCAGTLTQTKPAPIDPGVRSTPQGAGSPLPGLTNSGRNGVRHYWSMCVSFWVITGLVV